MILNEIDVEFSYFYTKVRHDMTRNTFNKKVFSILRTFEMIAELRVV